MTALNLARQLLDSTRRHVETSADPYVISRFGDLQIRVDFKRISRDIKALR